LTNVTEIGREGKKFVHTFRGVTDRQWGGEVSKNK